MALNEFALNATAVNDAGALGWPVPNTGLYNGTTLNVYPLNGEGIVSFNVLLEVTVAATASIRRAITKTVPTVVASLTASLVRSALAIKAVVVTLTPTAPSYVVSAYRSVVVALTPTYHRAITFAISCVATLTASVNAPGVRDILLSTTSTVSAVMTKAAQPILSAMATASVVSLSRVVGAVRACAAFPTMEVARVVSRTIAVTVTLATNSVSDLTRTLLYETAKFISRVLGFTLSDRTTTVDSSPRITYTDTE